MGFWFLRRSADKLTQPAGNHQRPFCSASAAAGVPGSFRLVRHASASQQFASRSANVEWIREQAGQYLASGWAGAPSWRTSPSPSSRWSVTFDGALDELIAHDLTAALAGDEQAVKRSARRGPANAVLAGQSLIIKGPPGTGQEPDDRQPHRPADCAGQKVLFVAEKRTAIDAVTKRLRQENLGELVLDLHGGIGSRRAFAQTIRHALHSSRNAPRLDNGAELQRVERRREQLNGLERDREDLGRVADVLRDKLGRERGRGGRRDDATRGHPPGELAFPLHLSSHV